MIEIGYLIYGIGYLATWVLFLRMDPFGCRLGTEGDTEWPPLRPLSWNATGHIYLFAAIVWPLLLWGLILGAVARMIGD